MGRTSSLFTERKQNKTEWQWYEKYIVSYFQNELKLMNTFSSTQIHRAIGSLNVNAVALQFPKFASAVKGEF